MGVLDGLVGTPPNHEREKVEHEVVKAPEFDITQYAKKLGLAVAAFSPAIVAALKSFGVHDISTPIVIASLGLTAVALLSASLVMAVDLAARAYLTRRGPVAEESPASTGSKRMGAITPAPKGLLVWLEGEEEPRPVLGLREEGDGSNSYLVAEGAVVARSQGGKQIEAIDGLDQMAPRRRCAGDQGRRLAVKGG
jgi:hypothetical protein